MVAENVAFLQSSIFLAGGGGGVGREKEGELAATSLESEFHLQFPCGSPSTELIDFRLSARM